ncbi:MAG: hypothetical protein PHH77_10980, partial [Victivallaceae bacterium]|nr:hypothetical protein [Victivallaceae bacterium]
MSKINGKINRAEKSLRGFRVIIGGLIFIFSLWVGAGIKFDFETGDLQGWKIVKGKFKEMPSSNNNDRQEGNFNKQGKYFLGTGETGNGICDEEQTGEIHSPAFDIDFQCLSFLIGGGVDSAYIVLERKSLKSANFSGIRRFYKESVGPKLMRTIINEANDDTGK